MSGIREYWDERAREAQVETTATTNDVHLRRLEIRTLVRAIRELGIEGPIQALDLGCGDGFSTVEIARRIPDLHFLGLDYSPAMLELAERRMLGDDSLRERITFRLGDATRLGEAVEGREFDIVITDRCLINLGSAEAQYQAIAGVADHLRPGAHYLAIENFLEGQRNMNEARAALGLSEIPIRWHNLFFEEAVFRQKTAGLFEEPRFTEFASSYYFATRVLYSALCAREGSEPDYDHPIHKVAVDLPITGAFSPIRLVTLRKAAT